MSEGDEGITGRDREEIAERVRAVIAAELGDEEAEVIARSVARVIGDYVKEAGDAERLVAAVGDETVDRLDGEPADDVIEAVADIVMDNLPALRHSVVIRRSVRRIVTRLTSGRADAIVQQVGDEIVETLIENGHAEALVDASLEVAIETAIEGGYAEELVREIFDDGVTQIIEEDGTETA
jgi:sorbitol-specific phosphotransferase system component IIA